MSTLLVLDVPYLAHRAYHTVGHLSHNGEGTGVIYGVLQAVDSLTDLFATDRLVFAFDFGGSKRKIIYPEYKANRYKKDLTEDEQEAIRSLRNQITQLRKEFLPAMGYQNVFSQDGYEADDVIASVASEVGEMGEAIIVSSDQDMWQLLRRSVSCYNPQTQKMTTVKSFVGKWGISPTMWDCVKALAGDPSDNIKGIDGVGLKTAAKWYAGTLKQGSKAYERINEGIGVHSQNIELIRLPFPGVEKFSLRKDIITEEKRTEVLERLGFGKRVKGVIKREKVSRKGFFD